MNRRDFLMAGSSCAVALAVSSGAEPVANANLGLLLYSYALRGKAEKDREFGDPVRFLEFAHERGAVAVQLPLGVRTPDEAASVRQACDRLGMQVEGIVSPPKETPNDIDRFSAELATARACGATVVRTVMLGGRRYEVFVRASDFTMFAQTAEETLKRADRIAKEHKVILAVENHKDFRIDELVDLLKRISSEWIGVCIDTGNNLALLEDPLNSVQALAPFARSVHLKEIGVEESNDGFRMSEVPLGRGGFDLQRMVAVVRQANPNAIFHLEMITRDPLSIPCLTEKYWATLERVSGQDLARTLARVRSTVRKEPLSRITSLSVEEQLAAEDRNVRESFEFAARVGLIPSAAKSQ